jgi:hypothetical protein
MPPRPKKDYRTSVILSEEQHIRLKKIADKQDVSIAWVVRQAVEIYLAQNADNTKEAA